VREMQKKTGKTQAELTEDKDDKNPFRKKQQKALSGEKHGKKKKHFDIRDYVIERVEEK